MKNIHNNLINLQEKEILHEQAREAYLNCLMKINDKFDAIYYLVSMNLLNAYVKKDYAHDDFINRYTFKTHLVKGLETFILKDINNVNIYYTKEIVYINVLNSEPSPPKSAYTNGCTIDGASYLLPTGLPFYQIITLSLPNVADRYCLGKPRLSHK